MNFWKRIVKRESDGTEYDGVVRFNEVFDGFEEVAERVRGLEVMEGGGKKRLLIKF